MIAEFVPEIFCSTSSGLAQRANSPAASGQAYRGQRLQRRHVRHLDEYATGVDHASDSRIPHLGHIAANCLILADAAHAGSLKDDRHKIEGFEAFMEEVAALKAETLAKVV